MKTKALQFGDTIGIIAPSRPLHPYGKEIQQGMENLRKLGFKIKLGKNIDKKFYYSAGTPEQKVSDLHKMFADPEVKAIICATGGSSSNQILDLIDYDLVRNNPKILLGYSDITTLLLAVNAKTGLVTFHGPDAYEFSHITKEAQDFFLDLTAGKGNAHPYPKNMNVIRPGKAEGLLLGGNLTSISALIGSEYSPDFNGAILFWEDANISPAEIDFKLNELKITGILGRISGMVIGHLSNCEDKKYPEDNRPISEIVLEITNKYAFPIIKVEYFGHGVANFHALPIGIKAIMDTDNAGFSLLDSPVV